jgi:hypothetical protein
MQENGTTLPDTQHELLVYKVCVFFFMNVSLVRLEVELKTNSDWKERKKY